MRTYEYKRITCTLPELNELGAQGWRAIGVRNEHLSTVAEVAADMLLMRETFARGRNEEGSPLGLNFHRLRTEIRSLQQPGMKGWLNMRDVLKKIEAMRGRVYVEFTRQDWLDKRKTGEAPEATIARLVWKATQSKATADSRYVDPLTHISILPPAAIDVILSR